MERSQKSKESRRKIQQTHGLIRIGNARFPDSILIQVHVLAAILWLSNFDKTKWILHKCNNGCCFNPEHLYQGNNSQNMRDMWSSGIRKKVNIEP